MDPFMVCRLQETVQLFTIFSLQMTFSFFGKATVIVAASIKACLDKYCRWSG
jgi:hypothetical protein